MKIFVSLIAASLLLTGCGRSQIEIATNNGIVKDCAEINHDPKISSGISLWCAERSKVDIALEALRGPMVVNVYGSWCAPCKEEIPYFREFYEKYNDQVQVIGIAVEEAKPSDTQAFIKEMGIQWPSLYDPDGRTRGKFGMGVPVTFFVDEKGKIVGQIVGAVPDSQSIVKAANKFLKLNLH